MVRWLKRGKTAEQEQQPEPPRATVIFTEGARKKLHELFDSKGLQGRGALRILVHNAGQGMPDYGMALEESAEPKPEDTVISVDGLAVLVDGASLPLVDGATVDFYDDLLRPGFTVEPPARLQPGGVARPELDMSDPVIATLNTVIEDYVNPNIAGHGGRAALVDVKGDTVYVELGGGCQGCSMASVTLRQGVERMIKQAVPTIREVVDVTDHANGSNPYFTSAKGGAESPYHSHA